MRKKSVEYYSYILSNDWQLKKEKRKELDNYKCYWCKSTDRLEVHHITYERLGNENLGDIVTLCKKCHEALHERQIQNSKYKRMKSDSEKVGEMIIDYININGYPYDIIDSVLIYQLKDKTIDNICNYINKRFMRNFLECRDNEELKQVIRMELGKYKDYASIIRHERIRQYFRNGATVENIAELTGYSENSINKHIRQIKNKIIPAYYNSKIEIDLDKLQIPSFIN